MAAQHNSGSIMPLFVILQAQKFGRVICPANENNPIENSNISK